MKSNKYVYGFLILILAVLTAFIGCSEDNNPAGDNGPDPITEDPFPMIVGRQLVYNGFLRDKSTDQDITSYTSYAASWTVVSNSQASPIGGTSNLIMDSTLVPTGVANPPVAWVQTPFFIKRTPPTGTANFSFLQNLAPFYRRFGITATDTLRWIDLAQIDKGANVEFTAFDSTWATTTAGNVRLQIVGKIQPNVSVNVNGTDYSTYYLTTIRKVYSGNTVIQEAPTASLWLAPNIGPVKMIINADGENFGHTRNLVSKNF